MKNEFEQVKSALARISKQIENQEFSRQLPRREWVGADVLITSKRKDISGGGFYPEPRTVVTGFSKELSWLFERLRDAFSGLIDGTSKIEFYGRLAIAAANYQNTANGDGIVQDMLRAVLYEAVIMLEEMEEGIFECLPVATGNTILADLVERAEESGYMGVEATSEFFKRMEEKYSESRAD